MMWLYPLVLLNILIATDDLPLFVEGRSEDYYSRDTQTALIIPFLSLNGTISLCSASVIEKSTKIRIINTSLWP